MNKYNSNLTITVMHNGTNVKKFIGKNLYILNEIFISI